MLVVVPDARAAAIFDYGAGLWRDIVGGNGGVGRDETGGGRTGMGRAGVSHLDTIYLQVLIS